MSCSGVLDSSKAMEQTYLSICAGLLTTRAPQLANWLSQGCSLGTDCGSTPGLVIHFLAYALGLLCIGLRLWKPVSSLSRLPTM